MGAYFIHERRASLQVVEAGRAPNSLIGAGQASKLCSPARRLFVTARRTLIVGDHYKSILLN